METLEKLSEGHEKPGEEKGESEDLERGIKELIVQEYSFEQTEITQGIEPKVVSPPEPQKLYPGVFMTPKPTYRKMSFAPGRTHPLIIGVRYY